MRIVTKETNQYSSISHQNINGIPKYRIILKFRSTTHQLMIKKIASQNFSITLIIIGVAILIISILPFTWNDLSIDVTQKANASKIAQYGDFIGGVVGSIFSLAGVILFYVALKEQREDFKTNTETLTLQKEELKLQRKELEETRKVFEKQSKTMTDQQNDNTFFNLLDNHSRVVESLKTGRLKTIPSGKKNRMDSYLTEPVSGYETIENVAAIWMNYMRKFSDSYENKRIIDFKLGDYEDFDSLINSYPEMITLYHELIHIHKFIQQRFEEKDQQFYSETLKNSMTLDELFVFQTIYSNFENTRDGVQLSPNYYKRYRYIDFDTCQLPVLKISNWTDQFDKEFVRVTVKKGFVKVAKLILYFRNEISRTYHLIEVLDITDLTERIGTHTHQFNLEKVLVQSALPIDQFPLDENFSFYNFKINIHLEIVSGENIFSSDFGISVDTRELSFDNNEKAYRLDRTEVFSINEELFDRNKNALINYHENIKPLSRILRKITAINSCLKSYFRQNPKVDESRPKELMDFFIKYGVFEKDYKKGGPIREILRELDEHDQLHLIPFVHVERKTKMTYWYFRRIKS